MSNRSHAHRTRTTRGHTLAGVTIVAAASVLVAACGGTSTAVSSATVGKPVSATSSVPAPAGPTVLAMTNAKYGLVLTNAKGFVLYTYTADHSGMTGCTGTCLKFWPPLLLPPGVGAPTAGPGVNGLGTFARAGGIQVTYKGQPLYTYLSDTQPGQVTGQDLVDSGGKWILATIGSASATTVTAPTTTVATPSVSQPAPTAPPTTQVPRTQPAVTQPAVTQPAVTQPPPTSPPTTQPPATSPPTTPVPTTPPGGGVAY